MNFIIRLPLPDVNMFKYLTVRNFWAGGVPANRARKKSPARERRSRAGLGYSRHPAEWTLLPFLSSF